MAPVVGDQAAQREPLRITAAGEQHDQQDGEQEGRNGAQHHQHGRAPEVEMRAVTHGLSDAERDRDEVGEKRRPQAERQGHRHLVDHEVDDAAVAEEARAEVEDGIVLHHQQEALADRPVEAVHLLDALDQLGRQAARAAIGAVAANRARLVAVVVAAAHHLARRAAAEALGGAHGRALDARDHLLDRAAGGGLHDEEVQHHDAKQRRHHQDQPAQDVGEHYRVAARITSCPRAAAPCPSPDRPTRCRRRPARISPSSRAARSGSSRPPSRCRCGTGE